MRFRELLLLKSEKDGMAVDEIISEAINDDLELAKSENLGQFEESTVDEASQLICQVETLGNVKDEETLGNVSNHLQNKSLVRINKFVFISIVRTLNYKKKTYFYCFRKTTSRS